MADAGQQRDDGLFLFLMKHQLGPDDMPWRMHVIRGVAVSVWVSQRVHNEALCYMYVIEGLAARTRKRHSAPS